MATLNLCGADELHRITVNARKNMPGVCLIKLASGENKRSELFIAVRFILIISFMCRKNRAFKQSAYYSAILIYPLSLGIGAHSLIGDLVTINWVADLNCELHTKFNNKLRKKCFCC